MDFSNDDIIFKNSVSDVVTHDRPKRCNSAFAIEQVIYKNEKIENKRQMQNSLNGSISCDNLINDIDHSKQRDDGFITVSIM